MQSPKAKNMLCIFENWGFKSGITNDGDSISCKIRNTEKASVMIKEIRHEHNNTYSDVQRAKSRAFIAKENKALGY